MLMGNFDIVVEENNDDNLGNSGEETQENTEEVIVLMHATSNNPVSNTMRFKGFIGTVPVFALIDSGSTHSFVNPAVLHTQKHPVISTNPMIVMVANGERMVTDSKCEALQFSIQGIKFHHDMRILPVKGYDVILGLDWLSKLGPMRIDWHHKWVEFNQGNHIVKLQVVEEGSTLSLCEAIELPTEWKPQSEILVAQIWSCEGQSESSKVVPVELERVLQ
jgi:Retroviral aspartyl protease